MIQLLRQTCKCLFPSLWHRLVLWKSSRAERAWYSERAAIVKECPDNTRIFRVPNAGKVTNGLQLMHNGLRMIKDCYYGQGGTNILSTNMGCHEPQEEVVFDNIIRNLPSGSTMVELGAYWGFYSMWFAKDVRDARVFLVEPDSLHLDIGRKNFEINGLHGNFTHAFIGAEDGIDPSGAAIRCVDSLAMEKNLAHISVLHSDIQGFELDMLKGASNLLKERRVDYLFISTHSMDLHYGCADFLKAIGYIVIVSVDLDETYSFDGLLVAHSPTVSPPDFVPPTRRIAKPASI